MVRILRPSAFWVSLAISKTAIKIKDDNKKGLTEPENVGIYVTILFLIVVLINIFRCVCNNKLQKMVTFQNAEQSNDWKRSLLLLINLRRPLLPRISVVFKSLVESGLFCA